MRGEGAGERHEGAVICSTLAGAVILKQVDPGQTVVADPRSELGVEDPGVFRRELNTERPLQLVERHRLVWLRRRQVDLVIQLFFKGLRRHVGAVILEAAVLLQFHRHAAWNLLHPAAASDGIACTPLTGGASGPPHGAPLAIS